MNHQQSSQAFYLKLDLGDFYLSSGLQIFNVLFIYVPMILSTTALKLSFQLKKKILCSSIACFQGTGL